MTKTRPPYISEFRLFLQDLLKAKLCDMDKNELLHRTHIKRDAFDAMLYRGEGGLDAWLELLVVLYEIQPNQIGDLLIEARQILSQHKKLSQGQQLWVLTGEKLSEDKRHFWAGIINFTEQVRPSYSIKKMASSRLKKEFNSLSAEDEFLKLKANVEQIPHDIWQALTTHSPDWTFLRAALNLPDMKKENKKTK